MPCFLHNFHNRTVKWQPVTTVRSDFQINQSWYRLLFWFNHPTWKQIFFVCSDRERTKRSHESESAHRINSKHWWVIQILEYISKNIERDKRTWHDSCLIYVYIFCLLYPVYLKRGKNHLKHFLLSINKWKPAFVGWVYSSHVWFGSIGTIIVLLKCLFHWS